MTGRNRINSFWTKIDGYLTGEDILRVDEHHAFGPAAELVVDRSKRSPLADNRVVHYDPHTESYVIFTGERVRFNTLDGVTVFPETSPWDAQVRQDPPVQFHIVVEKHLRGPLLYPRTERMDAAEVRTVSVFTPTGTAFHAKDLLPGIRVGMRFALHGDELLIAIGAKNMSRRPLKVALISFFMPLLTRGFCFNAESPWLHEGRLIPGKGYFIRSGEEGICCGIRYAVPIGVDHKDNTSSLVYYGGMDRDASFPAAVSGGRRLERETQSGFVAPACAHTEDETVLRPGRSLDLRFAVQAFKTSAAALAYLDRPLTANEVERKMIASEKNAARLIHGTRLQTPGLSFSCYSEWLKQQVSGCARIKTRFRLFWNYLLGIRDKAQAAYAATDFDPRIGREMILELSRQQFEDGRFPRQYSFEGAYDLRYFMDSGLWVAALLVPHYLKSTGDFGILMETVGYKVLRNWDPVRRTGEVLDSPRKSTVLDHLIENVDHVASNRDPKTGLVNIRDGDWNDAIGLIKTSTMVLEQLYEALDRMVELERHLPGRVKRAASGRRLSKRIPVYTKWMDRLHETFLRRCVQRAPDGRIRIIHGYTREGRTVGGFWDSDRVMTEGELRKRWGGKIDRKWVESFRDSEGLTVYKLHRRWVDPSCEKLQKLPQKVKDAFLVDRVSSTPLSYALLSGILRGRTELEGAICEDAGALDSRYGYKTFSQPFNRYSRNLLIGRIGNLDGAENASPYIHAGMFLCRGLYRIGRRDEANEFLDKTLSINRKVHGRQNRGINYMPNSWGISQTNDGASMNDFHSNSAAIFSRILVEEIVGLKVTYEGIVIQPIDRLPATMAAPDTLSKVSKCQNDPLSYVATVRGRRIRIVHRWDSSVKSRRIGLGGEALDLKTPSTRRFPCASIPWTRLKLRSTNHIQITDPLR